MIKYWIQSLYFHLSLSHDHHLYAFERFRQAISSYRLMHFRANVWFSKFKKKSQLFCLVRLLVVSESLWILNIILLFNVPLSLALFLFNDWWWNYPNWYFSSKQKVHTKYYVNISVWRAQTQSQKKQLPLKFRFQHRKWWSTLYALDEKK